MAGLTLRAAQAAARALGFRLTYSRDYEEYRLCPIGMGEGAAYYTTDRQDALDTARCWSGDMQWFPALGKWL